MKSFFSSSSSSSILTRISPFLLQMETMKQQQKKKKWLLLLISTLIFSSLLILLSIFLSHDLLIPLISKPSSSTSPNANSRKQPIFVESKLPVSPTSSNPVPRLAYLISGSTGDGDSLKRTLRALYHPLNQYVVHLDLEASAAERMDLVEFVRNEGVFREFGNVIVVKRSNLVTYRGPTMVTNTLHAAAILLKEGGEWDWFINLSASDYPLVTQDDLLHTLSSIPRHFNFIEHTSDIGWKEFQRAKPVIIDPGLYSLQKADVFWISEKRSVPTAFKLFTALVPFEEEDSLDLLTPLPSQPWQPSPTLAELDPHYDSQPDPYIPSPSPLPTFRRCLPATRRASRRLSSSHDSPHPLDSEDAATCNPLPEESYRWTDNFDDVTWESNVDDHKPRALK